MGNATTRTHTRFVRRPPSLVLEPPASSSNPQPRPQPPTSSSNPQVHRQPPLSVARGLGDSPALDTVSLEVELAEDEIPRGVGVLGVEVLLPQDVELVLCDHRRVVLPERKVGEKGQSIRSWVFGME